MVLAEVFRTLQKYQRVPLEDFDTDWVIDGATGTDKTDYVIVNAVGLQGA